MGFKEHYKCILAVVCVFYVVAGLVVNYYTIDLIAYPTIDDVTTKVGKFLAGLRLYWGRAYPSTTVESRQNHTVQSFLEDTPDIFVASTSEANSTNATLGTDDNSSDDFSYLVAILHKRNFLLGAGAIVGEKWIVVTAFQVGAFKADQLSVRVGSPSAVSGGQLIAVDHVFPHPMFRQFNNDVALLKTAEPVMPGDTARLIRIAETSPNISSSAALWIWGSDYMAQKNEADILPVTDCRAFYPDFDLTEGTICAVLDHELPFMVSLYGSPLVYNGSLIGLYMGMEANVFKPSLCSNLSPLVGWVHAMMKNETATQLLFPLTN